MAKVTITNLDTLVNTAVSTNVNVQAANDAVVLATSKANEASGYADTAGLYADVTTADKIMVAEMLGETEVARDDAEVYKIAAYDYMLKALQYRDESNIERDLAEAALEEFKNKWLGAFPIGPVSDPDMDGQPIEVGALYWNTNVNDIYVYTGSNWRQAIQMAGTLYAYNNLSDLDDVEVARDNLGVYSTDEVDTIADTKYDKTGGLIDGDVTITGALTVNGATTTVNSTTVTTADNTIVLNNGEVGAGVTAGEAGIEVDRGIEDNYKFVFSEADDSFKIGVDGELQKVATREDTPIDTGVARWDATTSKLITETTLAGLTIDDITNRIGADHIHYKVKNLTGITIPKGTVVSFSGIAEDDVVRVKPYSAGEVAIGMVHEDLLHGTEGLAVNTGRYDGYATNMYSTFTILYPADGGGLTSVKPTSGHYQMCATVIKSGPGGSGILLVEFTAPTYIGSTTQSGYVQLNDTLTSTSSTEALTANQGKVLADALAGKADVTHDHDGVYELADNTILKDADIGVTVQAYNANYVVDAAYTHTDNNYTTDEKSKLSGIETGATADQVASEVPVTPVGELTSTNVQAGLEELQGDVNGLDARLDKVENITGTVSENRYDKKLAVLDVLDMDYTSGNLDYVVYEGDDGLTTYYRDVMEYTSGNMTSVKHYYGTVDLSAASGVTTLTYDVNDNLITATYTEN